MPETVYPVYTAKALVESYGSKLINERVIINPESGFGWPATISSVSTPGYGEGTIMVERPEHAPMLLPPETRLGFYRDREQYDILYAPPKAERLPAKRGEISNFCADTVLSYASACKLLDLDPGAALKTYREEPVHVKMEQKSMPVLSKIVDIDPGPSKQICIDKNMLTPVTVKEDMTDAEAKKVIGGLLGKEVIESSPWEPIVNALIFKLTSLYRSETDMTYLRGSVSVERERASRAADAYGLKVHELKQEMAWRNEAIAQLNKENAQLRKKLPK